MTSTCKAAPESTPPEPAAAPEDPATPDPTAGDEAAPIGDAEPAAEPAAPASYELDGSRLILPSPIRFATGAATLDPASEPALRHIAGYLAEKTSVSTLRIEGHADDPRLSEARALAVTAWLVAHGVECARLLPVGFGSTKPIADASSPEGRAQNTRIEAVTAGLRGRAIGGMPLEGGGVVAGDPCR